MIEMKRWTNSIPLVAFLGLLLLFIFGGATSAAQSSSVLGFEDFDGGATNLSSTANVLEYGAGGGAGGDVFGRVDGQAGGNGMPFDVADDTVADVSGARAGGPFTSDILGIAGQNTTAFFAMNDMDGAALAGLNNATWTFSGWGAATITDIQIDIAGMGDFEASSQDGFLIEASADNGATFTPIFLAASNDSASKTYRALDNGVVPALNDPLELFIDGSSTPFGMLDKSDPTTGDFDTYTSTALAGLSPASVVIRVSWSGTPSGSEPMGIDNITINGTVIGPTATATQILPTATPSAANYDLQITELWAGNEPGENLSSDWFEITNVGTEAWVSGVDPALSYDDDSQDPLNAAPITGITDIQPGESVIVVVDDSDTFVAEFIALWSPVYDLTGVEVGRTDGSGLGQGGDGATLFVGVPSPATIADFEAYPDASVNGGQSWDVNNAKFSEVGDSPNSPAETATVNDQGQSAIASPGNQGPIAADPILVISEIADATLPGGLPKFVEITNIGAGTADLSNYSIGNFNNGGTSLGGGSSTALSGSLATCESYVISYENGDGPGDGLFFDTYGFDPDNFDLGAFINGDDVVALFEGVATGDGTDATLVDIVGVIGTDGTGEGWEYTDGYGFRNASVTASNSTFTQSEWTFGGANSLETGDDVEELALILSLTNPGVASFAACPTPPVITLNGDASISLQLGDPFTDPGATATDAEDGDLTLSIVVGGDVVDTNAIGTYEITYNVTDSDGLAAEEAVRTVVVNNFPAAPAGSPVPFFQQTSTTSGVPGAEIVAFDAGSDTAYITGGTGLQLVDLSDPSAPAFGALLDPAVAPFSLNSSEVTSVDACGGLIAFAVPDAVQTNNGNVIFTDAAGALTSIVEVGALPDMVKFTPDCSSLLVANEGEPDDGIDPEGSISVINTTSFVASTASFTAFNGTEAALRTEGVRIFPGVPAATDFEPEYIAVSADGATAFAALQENSAVAVVDVATATVTDIVALGLKDHSVAGNELDASDRDGAINIVNQPLLGMYMPDAIASFSVGGQDYYVTANEGDARSEDSRVKDLTLDPVAFPDAATLQLDENLGRIEVSTVDGDTDGDGDFDQLFSYGARSFSIWDAAGNQVFDSGDEIEVLVANLSTWQEGRSDNKGPEPEGAETGVIDGVPYAFIGLERTSNILVYDVSDPTAPTFVQLLETEGDVSPEGIEFVSESASPNGCPLLLVTNEVSSTFTVYELVSCSLDLIHEIQGSGDTVNGGVKTVQAIVTGDFQGNEVDGFFIQEEDADADADPNTSEGIFVYCDGCTTDVSVGDLVQVTGLAEDRFGNSQMRATFDGDIIVISSGNPLPTPASVDLPIADADLEKYEGMLVNFVDTLTVTEYFQLGRFGELRLIEGDRPRQFTDANAPSVAGFAAYEQELEERTIILDDNANGSNFALFNNQPVYHPQPGFSVTNFVRGGDTISNLTGIMDFGFSQYRIRPVAEAFDYSFTRDNPRPATPEDVGGDIKVATFNVLNFFTTIDTTESSNFGDCGPSGTLDCRGADSEAELAAQTAKIVSALAEMDADVVGLVEIENNESASLQALVDALNAEMGAGTYDFIDTGFIGTDAIKVGLIYKPAVVSPLGDFAILDSSVDPTFIDTKNRPVLVQTFEVTDYTNGSSTGVFTVAVNHFKSKGSACDDVGDPGLNDGQGNCNGTRTAAAVALANFLATDPTGSGDPDFLILGDINAYAMEDPIMAFEAAGYTDLIEAFGGGYSFVFDGQLGYLDHGLANAAMLPQVTGITEWHINADEVNLLDYNDIFQDVGERDFEAKPSALPLYAPDAYRSSDHDPLIIGLSLTPSKVTCNGVPATIYVENGRIVGGPWDGRVYYGVLRGSNGDDVMVGTDAFDEIRARNGHDLICALGAGDHVYGGSGDDTVYAGEGSDIVWAQNGNDTVYGEGGNDDLRGARDNDDLFGGPGIDTLRGGSGDDNLIGGEDRDVLFGNGGIDFADGGASNQDLCRAETEIDCEWN